MKRKWEIDCDELSDMMIEHVRNVEDDHSLDLNVVFSYNALGGLKSATLIEAPKRKVAKP